MYPIKNSYISYNNLNMHVGRSIKRLIKFQHISKREIRGILAFIVGLCFLLLGCNAKPETKEEITPFFTINGDSLIRDVVGIPDTLDTDVYRAQSGASLIFKGSFSESPNEDSWVVDGIEQERGKNQFTFAFEFPGIYQVKHCFGNDVCATRFVFVPHPVDTQSAPKAEEVIIPQDVAPLPSQKINKKSIGFRSDPVVVPPESSGKPHPDPGNHSSGSEAGGVQPTAPNKTDSGSQKASTDPPASFKSTSIAGLPASAYKTDCALWTDNSVIKLRPDDWCELHSAVVFGNAPGKLRITLTDGRKVNESMTVTLNAGKTSFSFAGLEALLQPGVEYTLKISTLEVDKNQRPKIGNASSCSPGSTKSSPVLAVNYGADYSLFDLKYKY